MIEPEVAGAALVAQIREARPSEGSAVVWRLGQSGLLVRFPSATVLVDPYLSNHCEAVRGEPFDHRRLTRAPLDPVDLDRLDLVICSHDHLDHLDPPTIRSLAKQSPDAMIAAPRSCAELISELGWAPERIMSCDDGTIAKVAGLQLRSFAVPHDEFDEATLGHPYLGWFVGDGKVTLAHLGDARSHPRIVSALASASVDLLAVPINGSSPERAAMGFAGNMNAEEAVRLAQSSAVRLTLPMHYDMFAQNIDPDALGRFEAAAGAADVPVVTLPVGRAFTVEEAGA
ncbi:MBL fold metallo-hydrolase [Agromyces subbeticus]|uniref:MBL fold metallo-hydrolase n=1 Tax=Agromyces subbeticus TaxID=293890 RepID=UPI0003B42ECB|nr:MBL fold metallo-hydrolase [Agromyces subbeticus]